MKVLLDSSALLAVLLAEPGSEVVEASIDNSVISAINLAEVVQRLIRAGLEETRILLLIASLDIAVVSVEEEDAISAGFMFPVTRHLGLSLGDRVCMSVAERLNLSILTADKAWATIKLSVPIILIR